MSDQYSLYNVLTAPKITEKSTLCNEKGNQVVFKVAIWANKIQIKAAVEKLFSVEVVSIQTMNNKGKNKRFGQTMGHRNDWKKAIVRLKEGQTIDFFSGGA
ncbi:MAG: 50S ribosomal protein L23 [Magnetococcales bacterium]|nr:50S ribosomal protein L23 [Magnetococcales bacterium]